MITLRKISETEANIVLGWDPPPGVEWYIFFAGGTRVSNAAPVDKNGVVKNTVRFAKVPTPQEVVAITRRNGVMGVEVGVYNGEVEPPPPPPSGRWFSDASPWNQPVPAGAQPVANSAQWIQALASAVGGINVNQGAWCPTVYYPAAGSPRQTVVLDNGWRIDNVPIPAGVKPSGDSDAHLCIIDKEWNRAWEFFAWRGTPGAWGAHAGIVFNLAGPGWWDGTYSSGGVTGPWAARASGAALSGGLIRMSEAKAGVIPHALSACAPKGLIGPATVPAKTSDGNGGGSAMPMGSRIQLDPAVNIAAIGLSPGEEMLARAMQTYGVYITDSSSAFAVYAENYTVAGPNPYPASWANGLPKVLIERSRIVAPPAGVTWDNRSTYGQPHK